ncbi:MAG: hypothetical protein CSA83_02370 [Actinomycetales bacterium]|nr:MAG: hypothetical protein CSA83_02370 [Actinomycetales bacterium]
MIPDRPKIRVVDTSSNRKDGLNKCPRCGSAEIRMSEKAGTLVCEFCRHEWSEETIDEKFSLNTPLQELRGTVIASGAKEIQESTKDVLTLKCQGCGAEVIVNTAEAMQSRCHWCRQTLSVNSQLPNGSVPDGLLPFKLSHEEAAALVADFVNSRKFFAHKKFLREFAPSEVMGVYMPFLMVDANSHIELSGEGEIETATYTREVGDNTVRYYDADVYSVYRHFDLYVNDLTLESSSRRSDQSGDTETNNVINAIQPFDTTNAVAYNANYLRGFTSEKRDLDIAHLQSQAADKLFSVGRNRAAEMITRFDRGVRWEQEELTLHGVRWVSIYAPVWLYSYVQHSGGNQLTHYVAVNGRTGNTMGSVPINQPRLVAVSTVIFIIGTIIGFFLFLLFV